ncbi:MAG: YihY/virulence factor BrkB family protein [Acetobacteraceae bacterium]|nr:YihY/virulence factor BrkB family protein [Acetobacteraceae bacterium]
MLAVDQKSDDAGGRGRGAAGGRGRAADDPRQIPAAGWKDVLWRIYSGINDKNLFLVAGGVTYYVLLALFPALLALVFIYGLVFDRAQVETQVNAMSGVLPEAAQKLIATELHQIVSSSGGALSVGVVLSVLFALWSASRGMSGLMSGLDIAYGETEKRSFIRFNLIALGLTLGLLVAGVIVIALVAVLPAVAAAFQGGGGGGVVKWVALIVEWPILLGLFMVLLALLYRYAPDRRAPQWRWASPGAIVGSVLWIVGSILFSLYVGNFANYNATYGSLGAVVVLLTWLYLSAFVVLLGAEINAETERQTKRDTTKNGDRPMGQRGAFAADTVGPSSDKR